jgi:hypothetical protein
MRSIAGRRRGWKRKVSSRRKAVREMLEMSRIDDVDVKVSMIQALIPMELEEVGKRLQNEVLRLAGEEGRHGKTNVRWSSQPGSIYLSDQKVPIDVPRVRNKAHNTELVPEIFGMSASNVSRKFKRATEAKLRELQERRLDGYDFIAVFIDGKRYADNGLIVAMGITIEVSVRFSGVV